MQRQNTKKRIELTGLVLMKMVRVGVRVRMIIRIRVGMVRKPQYCPKLPLSGQYCGSYCCIPKSSEAYMSGLCRRRRRRRKKEKKKKKKRRHANSGE
jgi:hypothetical protein